MKSLVAGLVLVSLGLVLAAPSQVDVQNKENEAFRECNATNPVHRNPRTAMDLGIITGERANLSQEEKCFLFCFLQKVNFLNENADIKNGPGLANFTIQSDPRFAKYADYVVAGVFLSSIVGRGFDDKCQKAVVIYHQFSLFMSAIAVSESLNKGIHLKERIINALESGKPIDPELSKEIKIFFELFNSLITATGDQLQKQAPAQPQQIPLI